MTLIRLVVAGVHVSLGSQDPTTDTLGETSVAGRRDPSTMNTCTWNEQPNRLDNSRSSPLSDPRPTQGLARTGPILAGQHTPRQRIRLIDSHDVSRRSQRQPRQPAPSVGPAGLPLATPASTPASPMTPSVVRLASPAAITSAADPKVRGRRFFLTGPYTGPRSRSTDATAPYANWHRRRSNNQLNQHKATLDRASTESSKRNLVERFANLATHEIQ